MLISKPKFLSAWEEQRGGEKAGLRGTETLRREDLVLLFRTRDRN